MMQRLPIVIEDALVSWTQACLSLMADVLRDGNGQVVLDENGQPISAQGSDQQPLVIWANQDGHRPAAPFAQMDVIAGPQAIGPAEQRYKDVDTYTYAIRKRCTLSMQFFGNDALMRADAVINALEMPSRQSYLQSAGIAVWGSEGPRDVTAFMDTKHEGRATLDLFLSYPDPVDDVPGEIRRVRVIGQAGSLTVDRTIDIEA
jgi:hypothetical protein